jgi:hypothetical protein
MKTFLGVSVLALALGIAGCSKVTAGTGTPGAAPSASSLPAAPSSTLPSPTMSSPASPTPSDDVPSIGNPSPSATPSHHRTATPSKSPKPKPKPKRKQPADPVHIVGAYFNAINSHDYAKAWKLTNGSLGSSYKSFVAGFATTDHDVATIKSYGSSTVRVDLVAYQTDGSHKHYAGTFSVSHGLITAAHLKPAG